MKKSKIHLFFSAALLALAVGCSSQKQSEEVGQQSEATTTQTTEIVNPVLPGDRPDPTVIKIGNTYYASATSNEWAPLFPIFKSDDLVNWELINYVFPDGAPDWAVNNFWAPELAYDEQQKKVYVYYTARDKKSNRLSVAVASADSPEGPYKDHGPLVAQELGSIDAYEVRDRDGTLYVVWKEDGNSKGQPTPMWAQQINEERTALVGEKHELFRNDPSSWEGGLVEGISIFQKGDYFYATYSAGGCCETTCNYKTGVARAKNLLGPWEKYEKNPVLTDNEDWKCQGHGTVVEKDGELYLLYHAYNTEGSVFVGREGILQKIVWTEDGWPTFRNDASYDRQKASINYSDNFSSSSLNPLWQWRVTQDITYKTGADGLLLGASRENQDLGTLLVQTTKSTDYEISATVDLSRTGNNVEGGVALVGAANNGFGAPVAAMGVSAGKGKVKVWQTIEGKTEALSEANLPNATQTVDLRMTVEDGHIASFSWKNGDSWSTLTEDKDASHLVPWGMGFRYGLVAKGDANQFANFKQVNLVNE